MPYNQPPRKSTAKLIPFDANFPDQALSDLRQLIKLSPLGPRTYENAQTDRRFGVNYQWMSKAKDYWQSSYDYRKIANRINSYPNFTTSIAHEGQEYTVQFLALFSEKSDAIPVTFLHGWPGSILEFLDLLDALKSKYTSATLPYHVVVPSLPGYGFSSGPPLDKDFQISDAATILNTLMKNLGFSEYVAQGGDVGSFVSRELAASHPECKAIHLNMMGMRRPDDVPEGSETRQELMGLARMEEFFTVGNAYAREHATRPSTIGFVLSSSPLALFAWVSEKFLTWTDEDPSLDQILDDVTLYWLTQSFPRSIYPYRGLFVSEPVDLFSPESKYHINHKPMGYSYFPKELMPVPASWVAKTGNLVWHKYHANGGHFAAMEKPKELLQDVEEFVKAIWPGSSKL